MGPRDLLIADHRKLFGRAVEVRWVDAERDSGDSTRGGVADVAVMVRAAQVQHGAALRFWLHLRASAERVGEAADRLHVNAEGLRRKLRGESWASLRDIAMWDLDVERAEATALR